MSTATHVPLTSQVGGHPGLSTTEDGSLLIKPALPNEVRFYELVSSDATFAPLRPFIPKFFGTLRLQRSIEASSLDAIQDVSNTAINQIIQDGLKQEKDSIVLENLSQPFAKPNIIDIKLGTVLYDEEASPEKRARMEKAARDSTSLETGIRLTGFQVHDSVTGTKHVADKSYGKTIKAADLPDGIARFFPVAAAPSSEETTTGLPKDLIIPILQYIRTEIAEIQEALQSIEMRMVGGSLLIIYEADVERAREGLVILTERAESDDDDDNDDDGGDSDEDEDIRKKIGPPYTVRLIDFAHTRIVTGEGPDQGVLLGVNTVLSLLDGRIAQIHSTL